MENKIEYDNKTIIFPTNWNELTKKQYLFVCQNFADLIESKDENNQTTEFYASKVLLIKHFLKMPLRKFKHVDAEQLACLMPLLDFLDNANQLNRNLVPSFSYMGLKYHGPKTEMETSSIGEFVAADSYFIKAQTDHDDLIMWKLLATLYRPRQRFILIKKWLGIWDGDLRQSYNQSTVERRAKFFQKRLHYKYKWASLYFYMGFRTNNVTTFTNLFDQPEEEGSKDVNVKTGNDYGWAGTLLELSGGKFGNLKQTENINWFTFFVEMSRQMDKSKQK